MLKPSANTEEDQEKNNNFGAQPHGHHFHTFKRPLTPEAAF